MIEKYGVVIISEDKVVATSFVCGGEADEEDILKWGLERLTTELLKLHFKHVEKKGESHE
jgi:hypothetical protein